MTENQKKNARLWIDALRSGDYQQGRAQLCQDNKYCCLGVACDLYQKHGPGDLQAVQDEYRVTRFDSKWTMPPQKVADWLGIEAGAQATLAERNDAGYTFHQIADMIEDWLSENDTRG